MPMVREARPEGYADVDYTPSREDLLREALHKKRNRRDQDWHGCLAAQYLDSVGGINDPAPVATSRVNKKFVRLKAEWKTQRQHESSTARMAMLPAYQKIIGMGPDVVPLLLRELATDLDAWFWALRAITEADPVREDDRGNGEAMAHAWLTWAEEQGIQW